MTFYERQRIQIARVMKIAMKRALRKHGTIRGAAENLGMPKSTFHDRAVELGIVPQRRRA